MKSNERPRPTAYDSFKCFDHDELNAKLYVILGAQGFLVLMGLKFW